MCVHLFFRLQDLNVTVDFPGDRVTIRCREVVLHPKLIRFLGTSHTSFSLLKSSPGRLQVPVPQVGTPGSPVLVLHMYMSKIPRP